MKKPGGGGTSVQQSLPSSVHSSNFQVPYPATPLFVALTKHPGGGGILPVLECPIRYFTTAAVPLPHCSTLPRAVASLRPQPVATLRGWSQLRAAPVPPPA